MENNRNLVLEAALKLFSDYGYKATGVQEICERVGVTKPTLYLYFGSKQGLLIALLVDKMLPLMRELTFASEYKHDLVANIYAILRLILHVGRNFWAFKDLLVNGEQSAYLGWFSGLCFGRRSPFGDPFDYNCCKGNHDLVERK